MRKLMAFAIIALVLSLFAAVKVGFLYVGPVGDFGWTYAHDLGRRYLEDHVPGVVTTYIENVPDSIESYRYIEDLVKKGYKIIFTTSFGFMDATAQAAKKYKDVYFFHCSGYKHFPPNFTAYFGRMYQPSFLAGLVAGMMTKTGKIGYVAPIPIPEVIRITNAFALGVKVVNPKARVHVVWTGGWFDPAKEREAAIALIEGGADVIAQQTDSAAPVETAEEKGVYSIGYNSDMRAFGPSYYLAAPIWNWGVYYTKVVKEIMDGSYQGGGFYWGGMEDGIVEISMTDNVPERVKAVVEAFKELIVEGKFDPFTGPLYDQSGKLRIEAGKRMSDDALLSMDWFVDNIVGEIPKAEH